jgi:predicted nucleotidyltransferase
MNNNLKFGLKIQTIDTLVSVFNKYSQIKNIIIYGSRAKGNFRHGSDIDICLIAPDLNLTDLLKIENEIDDLLLPYKMDLCLYHMIDNQDLINHIDQVGLKFN